MSDFKKGNVVELKRGGPLMTVTHVSSDGKIQCHWFGAHSEKPVWDAFPPEALKKVRE